ncbi:PGN_0703 family putative restriction endonuclease [Erythrobacter sp. MTPC3]|uniref:PGN_0703 family putative restriction endonuclease n=1 Tax=Erythrobacter sp. MTPC3 TaxID=3056564 RepID=UPI0036F3B325
MSEDTPLFLSGVPEDRVRAIFERAAGNEIASGKFANPQSSAALAANGFGWFLERPDELPAFPPLADSTGRPVKVGIECEMRFPWSGGRHPWLDAAVWTETHLIGVESKRYEPFRSAKPAELSEAYDRDVWGDGMTRWQAMRDLLRAEPRRYRHLDAAQLVKHALGIATQASREGLEPALLYLYAEPDGGMEISDSAFLQHRREIEDLQANVAGDRVRFAACSWRVWLSTFSGAAANHARAVQEAFAP